MEERQSKDTIMPPKKDEKSNRYLASDGTCTQMEEKQRNNAIIRRIFLISVVSSVLLILCLAILWFVVYHMLQMSDSDSASALNGYW